MSVLQLKQGHPNGSLEDLHAQVVRLKRHRDKLTREAHELNRALQDTQELFNVAKDQALQAQVGTQSTVSGYNLLRSMSVECCQICL